MHLTNKIRYLLPVGGIMIILILLVSFVGLDLRQEELIKRTVYLSSLRLIENILITRRWNASYGGVFVQKKEGMVSNPYLEHPDIVSASGQVYTLKNPALMTREISEITGRSSDYQFHLTSLKLMNPHNQPDSWEKDVLERFASGGEAASMISTMNGKKVFRYMRPVLYEEGCNSCHGKLGYSTGDVRGGISITVPYDEIDRGLMTNRLQMLVLSLTVITLFCLIFYFIVWKLVVSLSVASQELTARKIELETLNDDLERRVEVRTAEVVESENRFRSTFEQAAVGLCHTSLDGVFLRVNQRLSDILGYSGEELKTLRFAQLSPPDPFGAAVENREAIISGGIERFAIEKQLLRKNGSLVWVNLTVSLVRMADGQPDYFINVIEDISGRRELEQRLQQAQKMEAVGTLAGGIAHDFNNILTPILGFSEIVMDDVEKNSNKYNYLKEIFDAACRARDLIGQILAFSRQTDLAKKPINVAHIVKEVLKLLRASIPVTIEIRQNIDTRHCVVIADPGQVHQIIMNLCTNGYQAMETGHGVLSVVVALKEISPEDSWVAMPPGPCVLIEVSDTGTGMERAVAERIFDPYFTTKPVGRGTGLGLAIVHGIVESLGGVIHVYSEIGEGATFRVYLPAAKPKGSERVYNGEDPVAVRGGSESLLLVDDDRSVLAAEAAILTKAGYRVTTVAGSLEALAMFREQVASFDAVVTDMTMPDMTGLALMQSMHAVRPGIPVIVCTGYSPHFHADKVRDLGAAECLAKPILQKELLVAVRRALDAANTVS